MLAKARAAEEKRALYCVEQVNGYEVKRVAEQLKRHVEALALGALSERYGIKKAHRVLTIFEHEKCMYGVMERVGEDPLFRHMKKHFLFRTNASLQEGMLFGWTNLEREPVSLV